MDDGNSGKQYGRRTFIKTLAIGGGTIATVPGAKAKQQDVQKETVHLDTGGMSSINKASVIRKNSENYVIKMSGTMPPDSDDKTYTVSLLDESTSRASKAAMDSSRGEKPSASLQNASLQETSANSNGRKAETDSTSTTGMDQDTSTAPTNDNQSSEIVEPQDGWAARGVKGAEITSEDPVNLPVTRTRYWMDWSSSNGEVDYVDSQGRWKAWEYTAPPSDWNHNGSWFNSVDWGGSTAVRTYHVDYINWTWQWNSNKTEAFHRIKLTAYPDGAMGWDTTYWHSGEDAGLLSAKTSHIGD